MGTFNADVKSLVGRGSKAFSSRGSLLSLWQDIAEQFYVERAEFTSSKSMGSDFASHLYSSYPLVMRRELGNAFSSMLRPTNIEWFRVGVEDESKLGVADRQWLEMATTNMRKAMYNRRANFVRATKEADNDFAAFGQAVISHEIDWSRPGLLYRNHHLRDMAWEEGYDGAINSIYRRWKPTLRQLISRYGESKMHPNLQRKEMMLDNKIPCMILTIENTDNQYKVRHPWVEVIVDEENQHEISYTGKWVSGLTIPRWQTVSGSQYAYSPATVAALPDARLLQAVTLTLLEAGEMATRPPLVAVDEAISSSVNYYAGGITIADADYDERLGDVLRPLTQDKSCLPFGMEMNQDIRAMLVQAFFLNKLNLPQNNNEMTAYETGERVREYIRNALPLFEPMEHEYNGQICEATFELMKRAGGFGNLDLMPNGLRGQNVQFKFESPLHDAIEKQKGSQMVQVRELLDSIVEIEPSAATIVDFQAAYRDALNGLSTPAKWVRRETEANALAQQQKTEADQMKMIAQAQGAGDAMQQVGAGAEALSGEPK
jgi:hypothetical protein